MADPAPPTPTGLALHRVGGGRQIIPLTLLSSELAFETLGRVNLHLDDVRTIPAGFEARNGATTYRLSATELVVIDGETLYSRDPIVEYREARP